MREGVDPRRARWLVRDNWCAAQVKGGGVGHVGARRRGEACGTVRDTRAESVGMNRSVSAVPRIEKTSARVAGWSRARTIFCQVTLTRMGIDAITHLQIRTAGAVSPYGTVQTHYPFVLHTLSTRCSFCTTPLCSRPPQSHVPNSQAHTAHPHARQISLSAQLPSYCSSKVSRSAGSSTAIGSSSTAPDASGLCIT